MVGIEVGVLEREVVGVLDGVAVSVGVGVFVLVGVFVGSWVFVDVGAPPYLMGSHGRMAPGMLPEQSS